MCSIADALFSSGAVHLDLRWPTLNGASAPIYCDARITLSSPDTRSLIDTELAKLCLKNYPGCQILMGVATGGIAHAAIAAHRMLLPMGYVRMQSKGHGLGRIVEGNVAPGQKAVVVEDVIVSGGSAIRAVQALRDAGADVLGIAAVFSYDAPGLAQRLKRLGLKCSSLVNLDELVEAGLREKHIDSAAAAAILRYRDGLEMRGDGGLKDV